MTKWLHGGSIAALAVLYFALPAEAHALVRSSDPEDGASLDRAPPAVTITFTEAPDPRLSQIHVLNTSGQAVEKGSARTVPGDPLKLRVNLASLPNGVYTVNWRTVSAVDGHVAGGAFAFGIGISPDEVVTAPTGTAGPSTPPPSALGVSARWVLYAGLALLLGGSWVSVAAFRETSRGLLGLMTFGGMTSLVGLAGIAESQRASAQVGWQTFVKTSLGFNLAIELVPILAAALILIAAWSLSGQRQTAALIGVGMLAMIAIFTHVLASHAPSGRSPWLMVAAQWAHLTGFAVWIGGLAALIVGVRGLPSEGKALAVRRFSTVAGFMLAVVALTGLVRAIDEVGAWSRLTSTLFGQLVSLKSGLFLVLLLLGAANRFRSVPAASRTLQGLRRIGSSELGVAAVVLVAAALLTSLAPPSFTPAAGQPAPRIVAEGHDFGTTVRARLEVAPGFTGRNRFALTLLDFDTRKPVQADRVSLRFRVPARPDIGESSLELSPGGAGVYRGRGTNLSLAADWSVTAVVEKGVDSVEIPLSLTAKNRVRVSKVPGQPTLFTIDLPLGRSVQTYVDPGRQGLNQVHATFFDAGGNELPLSATSSLTARPSGGASRTLPVKRLGPGHFVGEGQLAAGPWHFEVSASAADGFSLQASFDLTIEG